MTWTAADRVRALFITVLGSGYAPFASGSWGSLASVILFVPLWLAAGRSGWTRGVLEIAISSAILIACVLSVVWGRWAVNAFQNKDPKPFVLDEFAGQWIALLFLPITLSAGWPTVLAVFFLQLFWFRVFDVLKLPPAAQLESLPDGWGILLDDLVAGVMANVVGQLCWRFTPLIAWLGLPAADFLIPTATGS